MEQQFNEFNKQGIEIFAATLKLLEEKQEKFLDYLKKAYSSRVLGVQSALEKSDDVRRTMESLREQLQSFEKSNNANNCLASSDTYDTILAFNYYAECKRILAELVERGAMH